MTDPATSSSPPPSSPTARAAAESGSLGARLHRGRLRVRRTVLRRRRLLAAALAGVATLTALQAAAAPPPPTQRVVTAARDLPSGTVLVPRDLTTTAYAAGTAPRGTVTVAEAVGRTLAAPMRGGEALTDVSFVQPSLLRGYPGLTAVPVRIPDGETVGLLRVGDRIDVRAVDPQGDAPPALVAADAPVIALPAPAPSGGMTGATPLGGRLVVIGVVPADADTLAEANVQGFLSIGFSR